MTNNNVVNAVIVRLLVAVSLVSAGVAMGIMIAPPTTQPINKHGADLYELDLTVVYEMGVTRGKNSCHVININKPKTYKM